MTCIDGNSPVVQWLGFHVFTAKDVDSVLAEGIKILQTTWLGQIEKENTTIY